MPYQSLVVSSVEDGRPGTLPLEFTLDQNYPNPFNPTTVIRFQVPGVRDVKITVFDVVGREVAVLVNEWKQEISFRLGSYASSSEQTYHHV